MYCATGRDKERGAGEEKMGGQMHLTVVDMSEMKESEGIGPTSSSA